MGIEKIKPEDFCYSKNMATKGNITLKKIIKSSILLLPLSNRNTHLFFFIYKKNLSRNLLVVVSWKILTSTKHTQNLKIYGGFCEQFSLIAVHILLFPPELLCLGIVKSCISNLSC